METTIQHVIRPAYRKQTTKTNAWKRFIQWSDKQEENRFGWTAFTIAGHGCAFTILTVVTILLTGNHFIFWPFAIGALALPLVANLAALPTRITIPILFFSVLVDVVIVICALTHGIDLQAWYR